MKYERLIYLALLIVALIFPFLNEGEQAMENGYFCWEDIFKSWLNVLPYAILVLIHTHLLLPLLLDKGKTKTYICGFILLIGLFAGGVFAAKQKKFQRGLRIEHREIRAESGERKTENGERKAENGDLAIDYIGPAQDMGPSKHTLPLPLIIDTIIAILLLICNIAIRLMFNRHKEQDRIAELEKIHIEHELIRLKAQISPHFFMNMLNNIHGMIEINPQKAQEMILQLSTLMRYVLYESTSPTISLASEIAFMENYIKLMKERFSKKKLTVDSYMPSSEEAKDISIPPLIFIMFLENAFKHGISYRDTSFINVSIRIDNNRLHFNCINSKAPDKKAEKHGGIGLMNIRKRLKILYGSNYTLNIAEEANTFHVSLTIPTHED